MRDTDALSEHETVAAATNDILGLRVRELRQARRISQVSLAEAMTRRGFHWRQQTVTRVESGRRPMRADELAAAAAVLGIPAADLLAGADGLADRATLLERTLRQQIAAEILSGARDAGDAA